MFNLSGIAAHFVEARSGATSIEYSVIAALIAGVLITGYFAAGADLGTLYTNIWTSIQTLHE
ncbi:MAG: Flp family type IVb pilin [Rhodobiaceae bacterium]|nr:Flp family type IVb pilin [Rhodobiaceae bacterium]